ncbi:MAG: excinuclease ABC subunit UvrA [bacterium]
MSEHQPQDRLVVVGASEHNLKNVDLTLPRNALTVFTGVSGSGKSSLAFDTIFQEGQRRFVESLSPYARQFLGQMDKPKVEHIEGLSPTISVDQKTVNRNPRSTVGTITEVYDHLRLLYARLGTPHCPSCHIPITTQTPDQITDYAFAEAAGEACVILAPMIRERKGEYRRELSGWAKEGYVRARIDGTIRRLDEEISLARYEKHSIELVLDRLTLVAEEKSRFTEAVEKALRLSEGLVLLEYRGEDHLFSQLMACPKCQRSLPEMEPRLFSFNAPQGACEVCNGLGELHTFVENRICDPQRPLNDGALKCITGNGNILFTRIDDTHLSLLAKRFKIPLDQPWGKLTPEQRELVLHGRGEVALAVSNVFRFPGQLIKKIEAGLWPGIIPLLQFLHRFIKSPLERFQDVATCPDCKGQRLNAMARAVRFHDRNILSITQGSIEEALLFFEGLPLTPIEQKVGRDIFRELRERLGFLTDVGVGYLTLDRSAGTLSGGEGQRIRLASQLGSGLQGVLYVLDEPSIGLHQSDNQKLIRTLHKLRDRGNTVLVVEHDEETMESADHLVDIGPVAGFEGGHITAQGSLRDLQNSESSITGRFLSGREQIEVPGERRALSKKRLTIHGARLNNLQGITVEIPLGVLTAVAGVSGSGKSSLIDGILKKALSQHLISRSLDSPGPHERISGLEWVDRVIEIDQTPIGRTPRSNPATYTKVFDPIRDLFAAMPESKVRGYAKGRFSFNVKGGRCEDCQGNGVRTIEMQFLADVQIPCDTCQGRRFNQETLQIRYKGRSIFEVLEMTVDEAVVFFENQPKIFPILQTLQSIGLGYVKLGQPSTTLSGGEAQRVKLASELRKKSTGKTLYILDEPTTGLHFQDIRVLLQALQALIDQGNTVLVIEHNLDVLKVADHVIELGPGGGKYGGQLVGAGTPEELAEQQTLTGRFLAQVLARRNRTADSECPENFTEDLKEPSTPWSAFRSIQRDLVIKGASKNNLRHIDVRLPGNQLSVITGLSGSGKTSLAFDTIFAEGQARYVESLSTYARRFLGRMDKAPVDSIDGLAPAIAIDQKNSSRNPRSTVATTTEVYDYLRLLFARIGTPHSPKSGRPLRHFTPTRAAQHVLQHFPDERVEVLAPLYLPKSSKTLLLDQPSHLKGVISSLKEDGFTRLAIQQKPLLLEEWEERSKALRLTANTAVDLVIDRIRVEPEDQKRLVEAFELAFQRGHGLLKLHFPDHKRVEFFSELPADVADDCFLEEELTPRMFSFNSHVGACPKCDGLGTTLASQGEQACSECAGERLKPMVRSVRINEKNISEFCSLNIREAQSELKSWTLSESEALVAEQPLREILTRLEFLESVGLDYLTLDQRASTLSGGEAQRIRLASQIGSGLAGVLYVLDEPTIGLHPRDTERLIRTLKRLRDLGNTVILVEHDLEVIRQADFLLDIGPGAGHYGGRVVASGDPQQIQRQQETLTGKYLSGALGVEIPEQRRQVRTQRTITVHRATENNLKSATASFPLEAMTVVTGVSGSGKSSLVVDVLQKAAQRSVSQQHLKVGQHEKITGLGYINQVMVIDQEPIGKTPRSNPATYSKVLDPIRETFAQMPEAKKRGFAKGRFSFNASEGRCPACEGQGHHLIEMHFLSDVWIPCDVCKGKRYNRETLAVTYRGKTIADVLEMEISEALELFSARPRIRRILQTLVDVGLGYMRLGQAGNTFSGGEAQRIKLASELAKRSRGGTLYILDEPTTGLHIDDVARLLKVLHRLVDEGNTVVIIEHHPDVIKTADWIVDLGPEGGVRGGEVVFEGTPEECVHCEASYTAYFLAPLFGIAPGAALSNRQTAA